MTPHHDGAASQSGVVIRHRIGALERRLHDLRDAAAGATTQGERAEQEIQREIDQLWDLLRQRNARSEAGQSAAEATLPPSNEVAGYLQ